MMNINDEDANLGLTLGSRNYRIHTRSNNCSGAGVNADSRVDTAFAVSDPLSELVWSPHNGLRLKCANSGLADTKPFLLWNVGPSSEDLSPLESIRSKGSGDDNAVDQGNFIVSQSVLDVDGVFGDKATSLQPSRSFPTPKLGASHGDSDRRSKSIMEEDAGTRDAIQKGENGTDDGEKDLCHLKKVQIAEIVQNNAGLDTLADGIKDCKIDMAIDGLFSTKHTRETHCNQNSKAEVNASSSDALGLVVVNHSEPVAAKLSEAHLSQKEPDDKVTSATGDAPRLKKLESSTENDLCHLTAKEARSLGKMKLLREDSPPAKRSLINSRICSYEEKGKEKALSDGDIHGRPSHNEDDSHESAESCNSPGLFSNGIKRQRYDQGPMLGSKRVKRQIHGSPGSASSIGPDSSFMNWISNMVKRLSDSNKENSSSLNLTLACSNDVYGKNHQENFMCNKTYESASLNMGFQTIFRSLYCRDISMSNIGVQKENESVEESRELVVGDETSLKNLPRLCDGNNDDSCKQIVISNKEVNPIIVGQSGKPWLCSADIDCSPYACENDLAENKASEMVVCNRAKDGVIQSDSSGKQMNSTLAIGDVPEKSNPLTSLWITRLSTKTHRIEKCNGITQETNECSTYSPKVNLDSQINYVSPIDQKISEGRDDSTNCQVYASEKEILRFTATAEASLDLKLTSKLCPILPSWKFTRSEAMASVFARRLDALRHNIPSKKRNSSTFSQTCFFCGGGHGLRECPNVTEAELEDFLIKMSTFDRVKESPCLCIRCFQLDHWAISCPLAPASRHCRPEKNASVISCYTTCCLQLCAGNEKCCSYHRAKEDHKLAAAHAHHTISFPSYQTWNMRKSSSKSDSLSNEIQRSTATNLAQSVKDGIKFPLCDIVTAGNIVAPSEEMLHAIRNLRLSRADILRWMNSNVSLAHLNGFFLRLRLGKLEAGLGGTTYYVACVTGDAGEDNSRSSKKSILVDVGGIKSSIGSQYISNHDFLEDEIKAWWFAIVKSGCRTPSLDELNSKCNDRKSLGF